MMNNKYITLGIKEKISNRLQLVMWDMLEDLRETEGEERVDYLQIFNIEYIKRDSKYRIKHTQEEPRYLNIVEIAIGSIIEESTARNIVEDNNKKKIKVYIIKNRNKYGDRHMTMLLAEEY